MTQHFFQPDLRPIIECPFQGTSARFVLNVTSFNGLPFHALLAFSRKWSQTEKLKKDKVITNDEAKVMMHSIGGKIIPLAMQNHFPTKKCINIKDLRPLKPLSNCQYFVCDNLILQDYFHVFGVNGETFDTCGLNCDIVFVWDANIASKYR